MTNLVVYPRKSGQCLNCGNIVIADEYSSKKTKKDSGSTKSPRISTAHMESIVNRLMGQQHRSSTAKNYLSVWRQFNDFVISLDRRPRLWEDRTTLFIGYLINKGMQSSTVKSYVSAIKKTLIMDGYQWDDNLVLVRSLAKACRIINDKVRTRLPIHCGLLEMILFEVQRIFNLNNQWFLEIMYKTLFAVSYYGLMRVGEVTKSQHSLKAADVHIARNKCKILLVLYSSKTHDLANRPQKIKITANQLEKSGHYAKRHFCPFKLMRQYINLRGDYENPNQQFFVYRDGTPVLPEHARKLLQLTLSNLGLDHTVYGMHSFRIGRTTDLIKFGYSIDEVKLLGRWKSNVIYKYIR